MSDRRVPHLDSEDDAMDAGLLNATRELFEGLENYRMAAAGYFGLTVVETRALSLLSARGPLVQSELGAGLALTPGAVTGLVDRLTANGVAIREAHPYDRRKTTVTVTEHGETILTHSHQWLNRAFSEIPGLNVAAATQLMHELSLGLQKQAALLAEEVPIEKPQPEDDQLTG